jgi:hypothetical protein
MAVQAPVRSATGEVLAFYEHAQPLVERLAAMAREWRETVSPEAWPAAVEAHNEFMALAIRVDLRISRARRNGR